MGDQLLSATMWGVARHFCSSVHHGSCGLTEAGSTHSMRHHCRNVAGLKVSPEHCCCTAVDKHMHEGGSDVGHPWRFQGMCCSWLAVVLTLVCLHQ
jgi:hypothetical protein